MITAINHFVFDILQFPLFTVNVTKTFYILPSFFDIKGTRWITDQTNDREKINAYCRLQVEFN